MDIPKHPAYGHWEEKAIVAGSQRLEMMHPEIAPARVPIG
jgi:hypothetical protein